MPSTEKVRVTKRFTFEMAHALRCHDGLCANIHGHSYVLDVALLGTPIHAPSHPKDGMVIDFADLKSIVKAAVIDRYDHALVLHENDRSAVTTDHSLFGRVLFTPWQPTCENLLLQIVGALRKVLPAEAPLHAVRLQETATSWAEWSRD
jgi:6-pyruvoyltetrahydropterin/6-carboxytetrahydropterin synthase